MISGHKKLIEQVVTNFISNAIKYSSRGGYIVIHTTETDAGVEMSVQDSGVI